jgi:GxxExxY protein
LPALIFKNEVFGIIGAAIKSPQNIRPSFLGSYYQEALELELSSTGIPFQAQIKVPIDYKRTELKT